MLPVEFNLHRRQIPDVDQGTEPRQLDGESARSGSGLENEVSGPDVISKELTMDSERHSMRRCSLVTIPFRLAVAVVERGHIHAVERCSHSEQAMHRAVSRATDLL